MQGPDHRADQPLPDQVRLVAVGADQVVQVERGGGALDERAVARPGGQVVAAHRGVGRDLVQEHVDGGVVRRLGRRLARLHPHGLAELRPHVGLDEQGEGLGDMGDGECVAHDVGSSVPLVLPVSAVRLTRAPAPGSRPGSRWRRGAVPGRAAGPAPGGGPAVTSRRPICTCTTCSGARPARRAAACRTASRAAAVSAARGCGAAAGAGVWAASVPGGTGADAAAGVAARSGRPAVRRPASGAAGDGLRRCRGPQQGRFGRGWGRRRVTGRRFGAYDGPLPLDQEARRAGGGGRADRGVVAWLGRGGGGGPHEGGVLLGGPPGAYRLDPFERAGQPGPDPHHARAGHRRVPGDQAVQEVAAPGSRDVRHPHTAPGSSGGAAG
ncbi:hypothetical protein SGLAM104S_03411 [Streptomyces glaucescens]